MFNPSDIEMMGALNMGERRMLGLGGGDSDKAWDELVNIRLKQDRGYFYWIPRGGSTDTGLQTRNHVYGFFFKARVGASVNEYFARQINTGDVEIYDYPGLNLIKTISGFTTTKKVQFAPIGQLLYIFDGSQSKYYNLRTDVVSDYLGTRSGDITAATAETTGSASGIFPISVGDKVLVYPPDLEDFVGTTLLYDFDVWDSGTQTITGGATDKTDTEVNNVSLGANEFLRVYVELKPGIIYRYEPGSEVNLVESFDGFSDISYTVTDSNGRIYFSVDETKRLDLVTEDAVSFTIPYLKQLSASEISPLSEFYKVRLGTAFDDNGTIKISTDTGHVVNPSDPEWDVVSYDEVLESQIGALWYELIETSETSDGPFVYTTYNFRENTGSPSSSETLYRTYCIVDLLDDGSVTLPGSVVTINRKPHSDVIGHSLTVTAPASNVSKRYLVASKYLANKQDSITPSSEEYPNSPWFIVREVDKRETTLFDTTPNDSLIRPVTEILPMAGGIPTIFGSGQITPKTVSPHKDIFVIGGYTINRITPSIFESFPSNGGNIYVNQSGGASGSTAHFVFEYSDGTYSNSDSVGILDGGSKASIQSLNVTVSKVHLYVDDGTNTYKIRTVTQSDPEFVGQEFELPITFTGYDTATLPSGNDIQQTVNLNNYVTVPVPPQQIYVSAQAKVFGNDDIVRCIPMDYDSDKTTLRYRLLVFTDSNIQVGYVTEVPNQTNIGYNVDFEIVDESRRALTYESISRVGRTIFFQDSNGVHAYDGGSINKVISYERYPFVSNPLVGVVFNERENELWFIFSGNQVYVIDADTGFKKVFDYGNLDIVDGQWFDNKMLLLTSNGLIETDQAGVTDDINSAITASAISRYLSDHTHQILLQEVIVFGIAGTTRLYIDDGSSRLEGSGASPTDFQFSESGDQGSQGNSISGDVFTPRVRGLRPRIKLEFTGDFEIEDIEIKSSKLANEGQARTKP